MSLFPLLIIQNILLHTDVDQLVNVFCLNKKFNSSQNTYFWKLKLLKDYPDQPLPWSNIDYKKIYKHLYLRQLLLDKFEFCEISQELAITKRLPRNYIIDDRSMNRDLAVLSNLGINGTIFSGLYQNRFPFRFKLEDIITIWVDDQDYVLPIARDLYKLIRCTRPKFNKSWTPINEMFSHVTFQGFSVLPFYSYQNEECYINDDGYPIHSEKFYNRYFSEIYPEIEANLPEYAKSSRYYEDQKLQQYTSDAFDSYCIEKFAVAKALVFDSKFSLLKLIPKSKGLCKFSPIQEATDFRLGKYMGYLFILCTLPRDSNLYIKTCSPEAKPVIDVLRDIKFN